MQNRLRVISECSEWVSQYSGSTSKCIANLLQERLLPFSSPPPPLILFFLLVFYLKMLNVHVSHLMVKTKCTPEIDVITLQCCLHLNRSCKSLVVCQSGLLLWNGCFSKGICDHLRVFKDKVSLGCFITSTPKPFLISVNLIFLFLFLTKLNALFSPACWFHLLRGLQRLPFFV